MENAQWDARQLLVPKDWSHPSREVEPPDLNAATRWVALALLASVTQAGRSRYTTTAATLVPSSPNAVSTSSSVTINGGASLTPSFPNAITISPCFRHSV